MFGKIAAGLVHDLSHPIQTIVTNSKLIVRMFDDAEYRDTFKRMIDLAVMGIAAHSVRPLRLAIWLALVFAAVGLMLLVYSVVSFFLVERTVTGWTSLMATVALLGAAQLLVLGIIGEYVGRILREARGRPTYIVAETETDQKGEGEVIGFRRPGN